MRKLISKVFIAFFFISMIAGCGFHLRGMIDIPSWLDNVFIISPDGQKNIESMLKNQLEQYGVKISPEAATAKYWLYIENESFQQQISGISSSTTPRQYQLIYTIRFKLIETNGKEIITSNPVVVSRQITINNNRILGSNYEESITKGEMRRDAVSLILSRISKHHSG